MPLNLKNALALLSPQEQGEIFKHLAEQLHVPNLVALAEYYQTLLEPNPVERETSAQAKPISYRTAEERATGAPNRVREEIATYGAPATVASKTSPRFDEIFATFDGKVFKPEGKIELAPDKRYRVLIDKGEPQIPEIKIRAFKRIVENTIASGLGDFAEQHDHYLYGVPKK